jgi:phosphatidate phosphatase PAH1
MSPDGYLKSFTREVIEKAPDQLKIKLLASVNEIFPNTKKPIVAGFGNRETDSIAYLRIKIPPDRIFCINEKSIITNEHDKLFSTSYVEVLEHIAQYFPLYTKPEGSEPSNPPLSAQKDHHDGEHIMTRRKLSHSEFYERSPQSSHSKEEDEE